MTAWSATLSELTARLQSNLDVGLTEAEAQSRLLRDGLNELQAEKKVSTWILLLDQFKSPVVLTLIMATFISAVMGEWVDAIAIVSIVVVNGIIGYLQEAKAEAAVDALKQLAAPKCRVWRSGNILEIPAKEVCLGDILLVEAGDYVAADARLLGANQLTADEALLSGESLPSKKALGEVPQSASLADRSNMIFGGTAIASGSGRALVTAIGMQSEIGRIAGMLDASEKSATPLQERLEEVSSKLLLLCVAVVGLVALLGLLHGEKWLNVLMSAISLAVAAIPEGLPAVVTLALALSIRRMTRRNAIVRHLPAVETLGSTDVICTDKTGTLTTGKMRVREIAVLGSRERDLCDLKAFSRAEGELIRAAVLCSNATLNELGQSTGDPTEVALLYVAQAYSVQTVEPSLKRLSEWSFDSVRKRMSVAMTSPSLRGAAIYCKGAPEAILPISLYQGMKGRG